MSDKKTKNPDRELLLTIARMLHRRLRDGWSTKWDDEDLRELEAILARYTKE